MQIGEAAGLTFQKVRQILAILESDVDADASVELSHPRDQPISVGGV
jgi:hypothetical protein